MTAQDGPPGQAEHDHICTQGNSRDRSEGRPVDQLGHIGVYGLATMGANLARNAARNGFRVSVFNRHGERTGAFIKQLGNEGRFLPSYDLASFVASLAKPRSILLMIEAGTAIDAAIDQLTPLLETGDIIIDAGNSLFTDTDRRASSVAAHGLRFLGVGVSGGEEGALNGPSMMAGGAREAYDHLAPILTRMAAQVDGEPCCAYVGPGGAGHYVKMVHNGIEYADMQAIAEVYDILRSMYGLKAQRIADIFDGWRHGDLASYLVDITVDVLRRTDDGGDGSLIDKIIDQAGQKGTGRWTASSALDLGVVAGSVGAAVDARVLSAARALRARGAEVLGAASRALWPFAPTTADDLHDALLSARIVAFSQGFDQLSAASEKYGWELDLSAVAAVWRGGCIIRASILERILASLRDFEASLPLVLAPRLVRALKTAQGGWRRVIALAVADGMPTPVLSAALSYHDGLRRERSSANLIQGLRDRFGAHGYRRFDREGEQHMDQALRMGRFS